MPDRVSVITFLIIDRPTCLACIAMKSALTVPEIEAALGVIRDTVNVYRQSDRCRVCGEITDVASVKRGDVEFP
jgi:hypothetical protein